MTVASSKIAEISLLRAQVRAYAMKSRNQLMSLERIFVSQISVSNTDHRAVSLPSLMDLYDARAIVTHPH